MNCDMKVGPCSCGAWHGEGAIEPLTVEYSENKDLDVYNVFKDYALMVGHPVDIEMTFEDE